MQFLLSFLLLLGIVNGDYYGESSYVAELEAHRIVAGTAVSQSRFNSVFPFLAQPGGCTATLIASRWVLSAAHCGSPSSIRFSSTNRGSGGFSVSVSAVHRHPNWNSNRAAANDVMLVRLSQSVTNIPFARVAGVNTGTVSVAAGLEATVVGWGQRGEELSPPSSLHEARVLLISPQRTNMISIQGHRSGSVRTGVCYGDSGGPLLLNGVQVGTVNGGPAPCENGLANYANVQWSSNRDWLRNTMNSNREVEMEFEAIEDDALFAKSLECMAQFEKESLWDHIDHLEATWRAAHVDMVKAAVAQSSNEDLQNNVWLVTEVVMSEWSQMGLTELLYADCTSCADVTRVMSNFVAHFSSEMTRLEISSHAFPYVMEFLQDLHVARSSVCM